jgi:hypothetical protein
MRARIHRTLALVCGLLLLAGGPPAGAAGDIVGTSGDDRLRGTSGPDRIEGRGGNDVLEGRAGGDRLRGNAGRDRLLAGSGTDLLDGGGGRDRLLGGAGLDSLLGRAGADLLSGEGGADRLDGGADADRLSGGPGSDVMVGGLGADQAEPGPGADQVQLGGGNDRAVLAVDGHRDVVDCGDGLDQVTLVGGRDVRDDLVSCEEVIGGGDAPPADGAFLTLHFGRSQWEQRDATCSTALPNSKTLLEVAQELKGRGLTGVGHAVVDRTSSNSTRICENRFAYPTWDDLAQLRDDYGWTFVSAGRSYADMTQLTREQQVAESCGSLDEFRAHGHNRANGLFAYPNNKLTPEIQANVVSRCFAFGRKYGRGINARSKDVAPHFQSTVSFNGGACNDATQSCSDPATHGGRVYELPSSVAARMKPEANRWVAVQFYRFVVGSRDDPTDPSFAWDCSSPDVTRHWTSKAEIYCWEDYRTALDQISPNVIVTDPLTVARAWGRTEP